MIDDLLRRMVSQRAMQRCEYCHLPQIHDVQPFQVDHIIALKHQGSTQLENLALACFACNLFKGPNIAGIDPLDRRIIRLFHPRMDVWAEHFRWAGAALEGVTPEGRSTVIVLNINAPARVEHRRLLQLAGVSF